MSDKLRMVTMVVLPAGILAALLLTQHQTLRKLREEKLAQRGHLEQLTTQAQDLSNQLFQANSVQSSSQDPPRELLRLRGDVAILRRQLQELQHLTNAPLLPKVQEEEAAKIESSAKLVSVQTQAKVAYDRWKSVSEQVKKAVPDLAAQIQILSAAGYQDKLLDELLEQRQLAAKENLSSATTDLDEKIGKRLEGIRIGIEVRAASLDQSLRELQNQSGETREQWINALERVVNSEEKVPGKPQ